MINLEGKRDFSRFMVLPSEDEERQSFQAFYDATSNDALLRRVCPICSRERSVKEGERTMLLSDQGVRSILESTVTGGEGNVLRSLLDVDEGVVSCWMCFECLRPLERGTMPKFAIANNLWVGDVPSELTGLTIPEQLLIARHYPRCYIFKLFPRDVDYHVPPDRLYSGMAGNASLYDLNTQEVVEMLKGQRMPSPVGSLASVIAITFVGKRKLPADWLKKTFRVRRQVVFDALLWLRSHNPIYGDIEIDNVRLEELPEDDVPQELLSVVRQEEDEEMAEKERESYVAAEFEFEGDDDMREDNEAVNGKLKYLNSESDI